MKGMVSNEGKGKMTRMTKADITIETGRLVRDFTDTYRSRGDGKRHLRVKVGPTVANCYRYPAYTAGIVWYEDRAGFVHCGVIAAGDKILPANKATCSGVARRLGLPKLGAYLARNCRWGSVSVAAALVAALDELDEHFNGEG
jgi:hypothetical protein